MANDGGALQRASLTIQRLQDANTRQAAMLDMNQFKFKRLLEYAERHKYDDIEVWGEVIKTIKLDRNQVEELKREEENKVAGNQDS